MAKVFIPAQMRDLTEGCAEVEIEGVTLRQLIGNLEERFPGIADRLIDGERLMPGLALSIDGDISTWGLLAKIPPESEVHFVPAIGGGA